MRRRVADQHNDPIDAAGAPAAEIIAVNGLHQSVVDRLGNIAPGAGRGLDRVDPVDDLPRILAEWQHHTVWIVRGAAARGVEILEVRDGDPVVGNRGRNLIDDLRRHRSDGEQVIVHAVRRIEQKHEVQRPTHGARVQAGLNVTTGDMQRGRSGSVLIPVGDRDLGAVIAAHVAPDDRVAQDGVRIVGDGQAPAEGVTLGAADHVVGNRAVGKNGFGIPLYGHTAAVPAGAVAPDEAVVQRRGDVHVLVGAAEIHAAARGQGPVRTEHAVTNRHGRVHAAVSAAVAPDAGEQGIRIAQEIRVDRRLEREIARQTRLADRSRGIDQVDAAALIGDIAGDVAVDDRGLGARSPNGAADAGIAVLDGAAPERGRTIALKGDGAAVADVDIIRDSHRVHIGRVEPEDAPVELRIAAVADINRAAEVLDVQVPVRKRIGSADAGQTAERVVIGEVAVDEPRRAVVLDVHGAAVAAVFPVIIEVAACETSADVYPGADEDGAQVPILVEGTPFPAIPPEADRLFDGFRQHQVAAAAALGVLDPVAAVAAVAADGTAVLEQAVLERRTASQTDVHGAAVGIARPPAVKADRVHVLLAIGAVAAVAARDAAVHEPAVANRGRAILDRHGAAPDG